MGGLDLYLTIDILAFIYLFCEHSDEEMGVLGGRNKNTGISVYKW